MEQDNNEAMKLGFFKAFNKCQGSLDPVKTDAVNDHFGNRYPTLAAVMDAIKPFMEAGFSFIHEGVEIAGKSYLKTTMVYNGYERSSLWPMVDDANPQHMASSATYAKRYAISGLTGLVIDSDDDGNAAATSVKTVSRTPASKSAVAEIDTIAFVPKSVTTREGEGPRGHYVAYNIVSPEGLSYSTLNETCGQIAQHALSDKKELTIGFKKNGKFLNVIKLALSVNDSKPDQELSDVPF